MKRLNLLAILLTIHGILYSQNYTLRSDLFDSLVFETIRGRNCETTAQIYLNDIFRMDSVINDDARLIVLQGSVIEDQNKIIADFPKEIKANQEFFEEEKNKLQKQVNRFRNWLIAVIGFDVTILLLLLL